MSALAALTAAPRSVGVAVFHGQDWVNTRHMPGVVPPPTRISSDPCCDLRPQDVKHEPAAVTVALGPPVRQELRLPAQNN